MEDIKLDSVLRKVRGLVAKAEHPDTPEHEAKTAREMADAMMLKYAIDQAQLRQSQPVAERATPGKIEVDICESGSDYEQMFITLVTVICEHTRTRPLFRCVQMDASTLRAWRDAYGKLPTASAVIYGFESDLKYFEILYTTLLLHMSNGIDPGFDTSATDRINAYNLHNAGFNWGDIAKMALKFNHPQGWDGLDCASRGIAYPGKYWKHQYSMEIRSRGEEAVRLPAKFTEDARRIWRMNFAQSYAGTIARRLWMARENRTAGSALVLQSSMEEIIKMMEDENPHTKSMGQGKDVPFNRTAWNAGDRHAKSADLGGSGVTGKAVSAIE